MIEVLRPVFGHGASTSIKPSVISSDQNLAGANYYLYHKAPTEHSANLHPVRMNWVASCSVARNARIHTKKKKVDCTPHSTEMIMKLQRYNF